MKAGVMAKASSIISRVKISDKIITGSYSLIILLGGACGTGKSTLASTLSSLMKISDVVSTDTLRHILRSHLPKEGHEPLFGSTYDVVKQLPQDKYPKIHEIKEQNKRTVAGYKLQSELLQNHINQLINYYTKEEKSLILEGVHLTPSFMAQMFKRYRLVFPFLIYVQRENTHKERFFVRSKEQTLDPNYNKYVKHMSAIRSIQHWLKEQSIKQEVPSISNNNFDKSVETLTKSIMKYTKSIRMKPKGEHLKQLTPYLQVCQKIIKKGAILKTLALEEPFNCSDYLSNDAILTPSSLSEKAFVTEHEFSGEDVEQGRKYMEDDFINDDSRPQPGELEGSLDEYQVEELEESSEFTESCL